MSHQRPLRHRTASATVIATALLAPAIAFPAKAAAYGCDNPGRGLDCNLSGVTGGTSGGGGGTGAGTGGGVGPVQPPPLIELTENQAIGAVPVPGGNAPLAPVPTNTFLLVQRARDSAELPVPKAYTAPNDKTYVRLRTSLWVDGFEPVQTEPITVGAQTVQAKATPASVTWNLGEKKLVCDNPGSKNGKTCTYTYQRASAGQPGGSYKITAAITWHVTWTCEGADCESDGGTLPDQTMTSQPRPLVVSEIQTNTGQ